MSEKIIARAAGREITQQEFNLFLNRLPEQQKNYAATPEGRKQALAQYANYFLFEKYGREQGYDESAEFKKIMSGLEREMLGQFALTQEIRDVHASKEECEAYYKENSAAFQREAKARAKHILTKTEEESRRILEEIKSGGKSFEDAAKEYSECPSRAQGGDLGTFGRGQMVKEFDEAVFTAKTGELLGPIKTSFGYHLIRVDELSGGGQAAFSEVYPQILQQLTNEKQNRKYMELREAIIEKYGYEVLE